MGAGHEEAGSIAGKSLFLVLRCRLRVESPTAKTTAKAISSLGGLGSTVDGPSHMLGNLSVPSRCYSHSEEVLPSSLERVWRLPHWR